MDWLNFQSLAPLFSAALSLALASGCQRPITETAGPFPQRGYLWQRSWTPAVAEAVKKAGKKLSGVVLLGEELDFAPAKPSSTTPQIRWNAVREARTPCALALRVAPFAGPFRAGDRADAALHAHAKALLQKAREHGIEPAEFQLDFDCAQGKLAGYRVWLHGLRMAIAPTRLVITALPAWLEEADFPALLQETDGFVLQVHSVPAPGANRQVLCDAPSARAWVRQAARLGKPFSVALPTYRCEAGYDAGGKLLGLAMDGAQPAWPRGTRITELRAEATELGLLIADWKKARPALLREVIWYRIPAGASERNWRWPTLEAVMEGRTPQPKIEIVTAGENPLDVFLLNSGENDDSLVPRITGRSDGAAIVACDALAGWQVQQEGTEILFTRPPGTSLRLAPGAQTAIGWVRYEKPATVRWELAEERSDRLPRALR